MAVLDDKLLYMLGRQRIPITQNTKARFAHNDILPGIRTRKLGNTGVATAGSMATQLLWIPPTFAASVNDLKTCFSGINFQLNTYSEYSLG